MNRIHPCFKLGALTLVFAPIFASMQSAAAQDIETITVLGDANVDGAVLGGTPLKQLPINTHVVGRAEMERLRFVDPDEFLDRIPGETQVRNLRIPDGGKGYTIPMLDGIPLESPYEGATQRLDRVNTFDIERVEIIKGPASALYPNNAFGGVVNVVTRDAPLESETLISIESGDFSRLRAGISTGGTIENIGYFLDANTRNLNGARAGSLNDRDQFSGKLIFQLDDDTKLSTRAEFIDEVNVARGDLTAEQLEDDPNQAGGLSSSTDLQQSMATAKLTHQTDSGFVDISIVRREKDTIGESRFRGPQDENDLAYNAKALYRHDFDSSNFTLGYDWYHGEQDTKQFARGDSALSGDFNQFENELEINAYYAQYQVDASDRMTLTVGGRYENIDLKSSQYKQTANFSDLAIKLGATYQLNRQNLIWLGISEGFYVPDLADLFATEFSDDGELEATGDPNLAPEEALNIEIGVRGEWHNWKYDSSVYRNQVSNYLITQEALLNGNEIETTTNAGEVSLKGIESVIEYAPDNANWRLGITHTFTRNTYDSFVQSEPGADDDLSGKELRRSPDHHLNVRVAWLPVAGLSIELEGDFYSSYFADNINSAESEFTRGERLNLRVNYNYESWRFRVHGLNLTDTMEDRATFSRGRMQFRTIDGRTFYAGASYQF